jgi:hypothetical protein
MNQHFVLLSSKQGVIISLDPEDLSRMAEPRSDNEIDDATHVLYIFNGLCQKVQFSSIFRIWNVFKIIFRRLMLLERITIKASHFYSAGGIIEIDI